MIFKKFTIEPRDPDEQHCNARIWRAEQELYCENPPKEPGIRCEHHMPPVPATAEEQVAAILDTEKIAQRVEKLRANRKNITELDDEILGLAAIIDETEEHYDAITNPLIKKEFADLIARMKKTKAEIIEKRINIEIKLRLVLDADLLWNKIGEVFERTIADENARKVAKIEVAKLLDDLVSEGKAETKD